MIHNNIRLVVDNSKPLKCCNFSTKGTVQFLWKKKTSSNVVVVLLPNCQGCKPKDSRVAKWLSKDKIELQLLRKYDTNQML